jgi:hypothetical protein
MAYGAEELVEGVCEEPYQVSPVKTVVNHFLLVLDSAQAVFAATLKCQVALISKHL